MFQDELDRAFPPDTDENLIRGVRQGIVLAADLVTNIPFLANEVGRDLLGSLRRAGILFRLYAMCSSGELPFEAVMEQMPLGGAHWVEFRSGRYKAHLCRTEGVEKFPEDTPTRQDQRLVNQGDMFAGNVVALRDPAPDATRHAWLTFGANGAELTHLCWGMPQHDQDVWLARTNVLARYQRGAEIPPDIVIPQRVRLRFREEIQQALDTESGSSAPDET